MGLTVARNVTKSSELLEGVATAAELMDQFDLKSLEQFTAVCGIQREERLYYNGSGHFYKQGFEARYNVWDGDVVNNKNKGGEIISFQSAQTVQACVAVSMESNEESYVDKETLCKILGAKFRDLYGLFSNRPDYYEEVVIPDPKNEDKLYNLEAFREAKADYDKTHGPGR